jgi:MarR family transcriptional regulator, 2-MHQ and catechol-resistance regulon repressor
MRAPPTSPATSDQPTRQASRSPDEGLKADAAAVFDAMTELLRIYQFRDRDRVGPHGVSVTQSYALEALLRRREMTAKQLAQELALEKSTVSRLVDAMVERGLVERVGHPSDARSVLLRATALGRRVRGDIRRDIVRENMGALRGLTGAQRATFIETIKRFTEAARLRIRGAASDAG